MWMCSGVLWCGYPVFICEISYGYTSVSQRTIVFSTCTPFTQYPKGTPHTPYYMLVNTVTQCAEADTHACFTQSLD